jgi:signal transduction histidine kinase
MSSTSPSPRARSGAWVLAGAGFLLAVPGLAYAFAARHATLPENIGFPGYWSILAFGSAASGLILALRRPGNAIGWLFLAGGVVWGIVQLVDGYAAWAVADHGSTDVIARLAAAGLDWIWIPAQASLALVFAIFPDGRFLSRRWQTWTVAVAGLTLVATILNAMIDPLSVYVRVDNPLGIPGISSVASPALGALALLLVIGLANLVVRFRRSVGDTRQQIKWLVPSSLAIAGAYLVYVVGFAIPGRDPSGLGIDIAGAFLLLALATIPIPIAIAILRFRLYDIDLVIRKTVIFGVLVALLIAAGGLAVLLVGVGVVPSLEDSPVLLVLAGVGFGLLAIPLYRAATRIADRIVYAGRESPYTVLASFSTRIGEAYSDDDVLSRMAAVLCGGTRAESATVWLRVASDFRLAATWPTDRPTPPAPSDDAVEVVHRGESLGALSVQMPANDPLDAGRTTLIHDLAAQAGPVLRNVRLIEELRASRRRLVAAQDEERRRLERNIHDGAQQQLVALAVKQRLAASLVGTDDDRARGMLEELQADTGAALEDLRDLARGIYPPLLADQGLVRALEAQARKSPLPVTVEGDPVARFGQDIEAAVYFACLEALQNIGKYAEASRATITLANGAGELRFQVSDDGRGFDPAATRYGTGLTGIADRLEALGGTVRVSSTPGSGTEVAGRVPLPAGTPP